jgi:hypothetical protein
MDDDLFLEIMRRGKKARQSRPDVPFGDLLFSLFDDRVSSIAEENATGETMIFGCMRTATANPEYVVRGSTRVACNRCGAQVWISPGTRATRDRLTRTETVCIDCLGLMAAEEEPR